MKKEGKKSGESVRKSEREKTDAGLYLVKEVGLGNTIFGLQSSRFSSIYWSASRGRLRAEFGS